jgi:FkbM family methyltransferase
MIKIKECKYGPMLYPVNDKWTGKSFDLYGECYEQQIAVMLRFIKDGDVVIDAGANIGDMIVPLARRAGTVIAFEPQEFLFYTLCGNIAANNLYNVRAHCKAVGDISGKKLFCPSPLLKDENGTPFYDVPMEHYGGVYLTEEPRFETDFQVDTIAIDDLDLERCDFIKLDVEGDEFKALTGAKNTIEKFKPVMFIESMPWTMPKLAEAITKIDYAYRSIRVKFYNPDNFFNNTVDELREQHNPDVPMMSSDIICYHKSYQDQMDQIYFKAVKDLL